MNNFLVKCMSRWTSQATRWLKLEDWDKCKAATPFTYEQMKSRPAFVGLDLAEKLDLTAACLCFPPVEDDEPYRYLWRFFLPSDTVDRFIAEGDYRWKEWVNSGELTVTLGGSTDYEEVRKAILNWQEDFDLQACAYDPHMATPLRNQLDDAGIVMVEINQRIGGMNEGTKEFEAQIVTQSMEHNCGLRSLMRWQVDNVALYMDNDGRCRPVRPQKHVNKRKIDGVVAAVMACTAALRIPVQVYRPLSMPQFV